MELQAYPNLPLYVVHPIGGGGCSCTLQRNYLLSINNNLEQEECENPVGGDGSSDEPTQVPHKNGVCQLTA